MPLEKRDSNSKDRDSPSWTRFELSRPARLPRSDPCSRRFNNLRAFEGSRGSSCGSANLTSLRAAIYVRMSTADQNCEL